MSMNIGKIDLPQQDIAKQIAFSDSWEKLQMQPIDLFWSTWPDKITFLCHIPAHSHTYQSGRSPKVIALFSATNFSSYITELFQLHDTIQIKWNYARIHYNIAKRSHLMI